MNKFRSVVIVLLLITGGIFYITACDQEPATSGIEESLEPIPNLNPIEGAENTTVTLEKSEESYFKANFSNIEPNNLINNGEREAWCIHWDTPISTNNAHKNIKLYSTFGEEKWKALNYFLNIKEQLKQQDPNITFREVQVTIWALMDFPEFDLNEFTTNHTSDNRLFKNGKPLYDKDKIKNILDLIFKKFKDFKYKRGQKYAVVAETPSDKQTIITVGDETFWAYGSIDFRGKLFKDTFSKKGKGQWGWVYKFEPGNEDPYSDSTPLKAAAGDGVGTKVGDLNITKDDDELEITYLASGDYLFSETHLFVGCVLEDLPVTPGGGVAPGSLPYQFDTSDNGDEFFTSATYTIDISSLSCGETYYIAAHGVVQIPQDL